MQFRTEVFHTKDGEASFGFAYVRRDNGEWIRIGETRRYREYPRHVRARTAADNLAKAYRKKIAHERGLMPMQIGMTIEHA